MSTISAVAPPTSYAPIASDSELSEWKSARDALYVEEKEFSKLKDKITEKRRQLPWLKLSKSYKLIGEGGKVVSLVDLFGEHKQLIVYHMMSFKSGYPCGSCTYVVEELNSITPALLEHTAAAVICNAPPDRLQEIKKLRNWIIPCYACDSEFCYDMETEKNIPSNNPSSSRPGLSVFHLGKEDGSEAKSVFLTYNTYSRGVEEVISYLNWIDRLPVVGEGVRAPASLPWRTLHGPAPK